MKRKRKFQKSRSKKCSSQEKNHSQIFWGLEICFFQCHRLRRCVPGKSHWQRRWTVEDAFSLGHIQSFCPALGESSCLSVLSQLHFPEHSPVECFLHVSDIELWWCSLPPAKSACTSLSLLCFQVLDGVQDEETPFWTEQICRSVTD